MALKVHHLRPAPGAHTPKTRKGRGEGSKGKTAGRGTKGTKARGTVPASFEGGQMPLHMRIPKLKGFKNPTSRLPGRQCRNHQQALPRGGRCDGERSRGQGCCAFWPAREGSWAGGDLRSSDGHCEQVLLERS